MVGVQPHQILRFLIMIHCQDLISRPRGLVSWLRLDQSDPPTTHPVLNRRQYMVCRTMLVSAPSTVSGILSQPSLQQTPENVGVPVFLLEDSICVDEHHVLHPFFTNQFDAGPVCLASIVHAFNYQITMLRDGAKPAL